MPVNTENFDPTAQTPAPETAPQTAEDGALEAVAAQPAETEPSAELDAAKAQAEEYLAMAQRVQADFDNYRRRNESARADALAEGQRKVASLFLEVLDNLERAVGASDTQDADALQNGVALTLRQMTDVYAKLGVTAIDRIGEPFDPALENAVLQGSPEEGEPGTVCQVLQKGYKMGDSVLRHAMVKVVPEE